MNADKVAANRAFAIGLDGQPVSLRHFSRTIKNRFTYLASEKHELAKALNRTYHRNGCLLLEKTLTKFLKISRSSSKSAFAEVLASLLT